LQLSAVACLPAGRPARIVMRSAVERTSYAGDISLKAFLIDDKLSKNSEYKIERLLYGGGIIIVT
jgi:hypothetical protein